MPDGATEVVPPFIFVVYRLPTLDATHGHAVNA